MLKTTNNAVAAMNIKSFMILVLPLSDQLTLSVDLAAFQLVLVKDESASRRLR